jgi:hypothetical protein
MSVFHSALAARYDLGMALSAVLARHHLSSLPMPLLRGYRSAAFLTEEAIERSGHLWRVNIESELPISVISAFVRAHDASYYSNATRKVPTAFRIIKILLPHSEFRSRFERHDARLAVVAQRAKTVRTEIQGNYLARILCQRERGFS